MVVSTNSWAVFEREAFREGVFEQIAEADVPVPSSIPLDMPIPILKELKGLRRGGPQADAPRLAGTVCVSKTSSPQSNVRRTPVGSPSGATRGSLSNASSPQPGKEGRGLKVPHTPKSGRGVSKIAVQSPRPPPRTSSAVTSPKPQTKLPVNARDLESRMKIGQIKRPDPLPECAATCYSAPSNAVSSYGRNICGLVAPASSSNRSSLISNSSSIPPPSSSSSNRNSSSSLGSNFSIGSWNSNCGGVCDKAGGAETYPRIAGTRRSCESTNPISESAKIEMRIPSNSWSRSFPKRKLEASGIAVSFPLSSSESAIDHPRPTNNNNNNKPLYNHSDSNLLQFKESKLHGSSIRSSGNQSSVADVTPSVVRQLYPRSPKTSHRLPRNKTKASKMKSDSASARHERPPARDSTDEDDGYSSVALTDQHEDDGGRTSSFKYPSHDEIVELDCVDDIQPMKPLEGISGYNYVLRAGAVGRISNSDTESDPSQNSGSGLALHDDHQKIGSNASAICEETSSKVGVLKPSLVSCHLQTSSSDKKQPVIESHSFSNLDSSILSLSYKDFVNLNGIKQNSTSTWMARNLNSGSLPLSSPRKPQLSSMRNGYPEAPSLSSFAQQPLPVVSSSRCLDSLSECRPTSGPSFVSPGRILPIEEERSPHFFRSRSLRSPKHDPNSSSSTETSPVSDSPAFGMSTFIRNSPKYSTVIPRTIKQGPKINYYYSNVTPEADGSGECSRLKTTFSSGSANWESLQKELVCARQEVKCLNEKLQSTNKLVSAYEHSLSNMTIRLQQLTKATEQKEAEMVELRRLLERPCLDSPGIDSRSSTLRVAMKLSSSIESLTSLASNASISSAVSSSSAISYESRQNANEKRKSWLRSSFSKAFRRREKPKRKAVSPMQDPSAPADAFLGGSISDVEDCMGYYSLPSSPITPQRTIMTLPKEGIVTGMGTSSANPNVQYLMDANAILKRTLREKDTALTESRLESLSCSHQIEGLKESLKKLSSELGALKMDRNEFTARSNRGYFACDSESLAEGSHRVSGSFVSWSKAENAVQDGKPLRVSVLMGESDRELEWKRRDTDVLEIGFVTVCCRTSWQELDRSVNSLFEKYLLHLDSCTKLSLSGDSVFYYQLGEIRRASLSDLPELLPYGYIVGDVMSIEVRLQPPSLNSPDSMAFETLIPKCHLQRYITALRENRRVILAGPEGVGKSFLAENLAEFLVQRLGIEPSNGNIAKFNINERTAQDLCAYLSQLSDLCESKSTDIPLVIVLEGLERAEKLSQILSTSLRVPHDQCPFIIGTYRHSGNVSQLLTIHQSFRTINLDPVQEPVCGLLARICRRSFQIEKLSDCRDSESLTSLFEWLPRCWDLISKATNSSSLAVKTYGPGICLPLPSSFSEAQLWFFDLWKTRLLPALQEASAAEPFSLPDSLQNWQELGKCLREELPWLLKDEVELPEIMKQNV